MEHPADTAKSPWAALFTRKDLLTTSIISVVYLLLSKLLIGFKADQLFLVTVFHLMYYASLPTRRLIIGFAPFIVFWIIFDYMKAFPNYRYSDVHIESLYNKEKALFGISSGTQTVTPNEYFLQHNNRFLDILTGVFYLCWVPVPLLFTVWLFFKDRTKSLHFALTFLFVNLLGFIVYYSYPAAPPWYVQQHGFGFNPATPGNTAGLARFDQFFGINLFTSMYAKSSNVFAAMPSLHSAYPLIVLFHGIKNRLGKINVLFATIMVGIWFAAVYTSHHYVLDVVAGIICAVTGIVLYEKLLVPNKGYRQFIQKLQKAV